MNDTTRFNEDGVGSNIKSFLLGLLVAFLLVIVNQASNVMATTEASAPAIIGPQFSCADPAQVEMRRNRSLSGIAAGCE